MYQEVKPLSFGIVGSGTAGLIAALLIRQSFPKSEITIVSSSSIGIIGVGEGSTEHWKDFMDFCRIPLHEMLIKSSATHKYGIRFENWTNKTPDYFHSVAGDEAIFAQYHYATYDGFLEAGQTLTSQTTSIGLIQNKIRRENLHGNTNQFHFDTFKLNGYFTDLCFKRQIRFVEGEVTDVVFKVQDNIIDSVLVGDIPIKADFWIDASGFRRVLMSKFSQTTWNSFSKYLLTDSAIAFPTESDPSGEIRSYTRARAMSSGWVWEIPTQDRRGNGYVFSSKHISEEQAAEEVSKLLGMKVSASRSFKFDAGHLEKPWIGNCCAVGLASAFVEPLEATSIGTTIQQVKQLMPNIASYADGSFAMQRRYNKNMCEVMDNVLSMIRLHYISDRRDTPFWKDMAEMPINDSLKELLELWNERPPTRLDFSPNIGLLFSSPHFYHVGQGQGVINPIGATLAIDNLCIRQEVEYDMHQRRLARYSHELIDHAQALRELEA